MNRMKTYIYCCLSVMLFGLSACENELELDTKTASKQLSVNGFINADSTINRLLVSFTGIDHPTIVTDATIKVSVNGNRARPFMSFLQVRSNTSSMVVSTQVTMCASRYLHLTTTIRHL